MSPRSAWLIGVVCGAAALWAVFNALPPRAPAPQQSSLAMANDEDDDDEEAAAVAARLSIVDGRRRVHLSADARELAGLEVAVLEAGAVAAEEHLVGRVADAAALFSAQRALALVGARVASQRALIAALQGRLTVLSRLAADGALAVTREVTELERELARERGVLLEHRADDERARGDLARRWGAPLLETLAADTALARELDTGAAALLAVQVPAGRGAAAPQIVVAVDGQRATARAARVVAVAPGAADAAHGRSWWASVSGLELRREMRVDVWLSGGPPRAGVVLPAAASVWHAGRAWYFVEVAPLTFERRGLSAAAATGSGYLLAQPPRAPVVVRGAQALLAEEFRGAIPVEDDD